MNPFNYWDTDPSGYLRHVMAGAFLLLAAKAIVKNKMLVLGLILGVAIAKELVDVILGKTAEMLDVFFTVAPVLLYEVCSKIDRIKNKQQPHA
jgi:hypothetical protein